MRNDSTHGIAGRRTAPAHRRGPQASSLLPAVLAGLSTPVWVLHLPPIANRRRKQASSKKFARDSLYDDAHAVFVNEAACKFHRAENTTQLAIGLHRVFDQESLRAVAQAAATQQVASICLGRLDGSKQRACVRADTIESSNAATIVAVTITPGVPQRNLLRAMPDLAFEIDANGVYLDYASADVDCIPGDFLGKSITDTMPHDVAHRAMTALRRLQEQGGSERFEYALSMSDGLHWYEARLGALPSGGASIYVRDITEQKTTGWRLQESEQRFRSMADSAPVLLWMTDTTGACVFVNRTWLEFTGRTLDAERGERWMEHLHPDDLHRCRSLLHEHTAHHRRFRIEYRLRRHDGQYRWLLHRAEPRVSPDGTFVGFVGSCVDITEIKAAQSELDANVIARTLELEVANRDLEAFSYSVAHDLRAPLRAIGGFTQMLLDRKEAGFDSENVHYLERVCANARHMDRLITDLLRLARVSRAEIASEVVDVSAIAHEIIHRLEHTEVARCVSVSVQPDIRIRGDSGLIRIVLENLLGNAWKFTAKNPSGKIELGAFTQDDATVCFVRDNGVGFDMQYADRLFGAFQRLHNPDEFEGSGIGLAMAERIIQRHRGRIWADAKVGKGATFYFSVENESQTR